MHVIHPRGAVMAEDDPVPCGEFSEFKEALQQLRAIDDKIVYKLNTTVPTVSFDEEHLARDRCKLLYEQLQSVHKRRSSAIQQCVDHTVSVVKELREKGSSEDRDTVKKLRKTQTNLRLMQSELVVEEAVRDRSMKVFMERCWRAYKPQDLKK